MLSTRRTLAAIAVAAIAGVGAGLAIGLGDEDSEPAPAPIASTAPEPPEAPGDRPSKPSKPDRGDRDLPPPEDDPEGAEPGPSGPPPGTTDEREAARAARAYVAALDRRDGAAVCRAFVPGALDELRLPRERGSCASSVRASLGFERRGFPVWQASRLTGDLSAELDGDSARVVATVFTLYADVREPTIEDDIVYLVRSGERWLVAQPSLTLYRAIGEADPPPSVLSPPG